MSVSVVYFLVLDNCPNLALAGPLGQEWFSLFSTHTEPFLTSVNICFSGALFFFCLCSTVLVPYGCCNKFHQLGDLKFNRNLFSYKKAQTSLTEPKSRCVGGWGEMRVGLSPRAPEEDPFHASSSFWCGQQSLACGHIALFSASVVTSPSLPCVCVKSSSAFLV